MGEDREEVSPQTGADGISKGMELRSHAECSGICSQQSEELRGGSCTKEMESDNRGLRSQC